MENNISDDKIKYHAQVLADLHSVWKPHAGQIPIGKALFMDGKKRVMLQCGRKFGKTECVIYSLYRWCLLYPNSYSYYIAPYKDQIRDLVWSNGRMPFFLTDELMKKYGIKINNSDFRVIFGNGSFIRCDGSDNFEKSRGYSATGLCVYDELKDINPKFHHAFEPNLAITDAPLLMVGTPPNSSDPQFDEWNRVKDEITSSEVGAFFHRPSMANPHVSKEYFIRKEAELRAKSEYWKWQQEYLAELVRAAGNNIFPMLDKKKHIRSYDELINTIRLSHKHWDWFAAFDPGSAKCFAVVIGAVNRYSKQVFILDEIYATKLEEARVSHVVPKFIDKARQIHPIMEDWYCVYDYAATWFMNEVQDHYGEEISVHPCQKDLKNKENKLSLIKEMLLKGFLIMSDKCEKLYWEMEKYATDENGKIPKEDDHCFVGSTLITTINGKKQIKDIIVGDLVLTRNGYKKVLKKWENGKKQIYKLKTNTGIEINLTLGHKIFTLNRGFVKVENLKKGDVLCTERELKLNLMGRFTYCFLSLKTKILQAILDVLKGLQG